MRNFTVTEQKFYMQPKTKVSAINTLLSSSTSNKQISFSSIKLPMHKNMFLIPGFYFVSYLFAFDTSVLHFTAQTNFAKTAVNISVTCSTGKTT